MTRSLLGLVGLNAVYLLAGAGLLWGIRGWRSWAEAVRLAAFAYLLGVGTVGVVLSEVLVAGGSARVPVVLAVAAGVAVAGIVAGRLAGRGLPRRIREERRAEPFLLVSMGAAALALLLLAAYVRAAHDRGEWEYDAWAFWTPKAETIYYFGGLDPTLFARFAGPSYPILVPGMQAAAFHFMGGVDTVTLHVQYAILLAGFVLAVAGLLRPRVPLVLVWPFLALLAALPSLEERALYPQADLLLDYFFVLAALALAAWLASGERWLLAPYGIFLAAAMTTKREGQMLTAVLVLSALVATATRRRADWPWVVGPALAALALTLPWRFWLSAHGIGGEWEDASLSGMLHHLGRVGPAIRVSAGLLFDYGLWLLAVPIGIAAGLTLLLRTRDRLGVLFFGVLGFGFAAMVWIYWAFLRLPLDASDQSPVPRVIGALVLFAVALPPLLLARALEAEEERGMRRLRRSPDVWAAGGRLRAAALLHWLQGRAIGSPWLSAGRAAHGRRGALPRDGRAVGAANALLVRDGAAVARRNGDGIRARQGLERAARRGGGVPRLRDRAVARAPAGGERGGGRRGGRSGHHRRLERRPGPARLRAGGAWFAGRRAGTRRRSARGSTRGHPARACGGRLAAGARRGCPAARHARGRRVDAVRPSRTARHGRRAVPRRWLHRLPRRPVRLPDLPGDDRCAGGCTRIRREVARCARVGRRAVARGCARPCRGSLPARRLRRRSWGSASAPDSPPSRSCRC